MDFERVELKSFKNKINSMNLSNKRELDYSMSRNDRLSFSDSDDDFRIRRPSVEIIGRVVPLNL